MALMLRHISGKRDFDLFAAPGNKERLFAKDDVQAILADFNARRLSDHVQQHLSERDSPMHFYDVGLDVFFEATVRHGYPHQCVDDAVLEVMSHRHDYRNDADMQKWMYDNLVHVKYDLAEDGGVRVGQALPLDTPLLRTLDNAPRTLRDILPDGRKPLAVLAGSWS